MNMPVFPPEKDCCQEEILLAAFPTKVKKPDFTIPLPQPGFIGLLPENVLIGQGGSCWQR